MYEKQCFILLVVAITALLGCSKEVEINPSLQSQNPNIAESKPVGG